jgi:hypothetical protein
LTGCSKGWVSSLFAAKAMRPASSAVLPDMGV